MWVRYVWSGWDGYFDEINLEMWLVRGEGHLEISFVIGDIDLDGKV